MSKPLDDQMVDDFASACLRAGQSNSGLSINARATPDWARMQEWREAVHERLASLRAEADLYQRGYAAIGACDISNYLALCQLANGVETMRDLLQKRLDALLRHGDPFDGDDWQEVQDIREALNRQ